MKSQKININIFIFSGILYLSLIYGFLIDENLNYGGHWDWVGSNLSPVNDFSNNFSETLLNYESYGHRHSPVYLIFLSLFLDLGFEIYQVRVIHLHFCILLIVLFYKCLKLKFPNIDRNNLTLLSLVIFLSPTFRTLSIWPDSRLPGLIFFVLSVYFFLKFIKNNNFIYCW